MIKALAEYEPGDATEAADLARIADMMSRTIDPWSRDTPLHLTASAVIVHPPTSRVLLRWHERQLAWLQVGGHADPGETYITYWPPPIQMRLARNDRRRRYDGSACRRRSRPRPRPTSGRLWPGLGSFSVHSGQHSGWVIVRCVTDPRFFPCELPP
jgi:hypothetical protein